MTRSWDIYNRKIWIGAIFVIALITYAFAGSMLRKPASAAGASLLFSPPSGSFSSASFVMKVVLNSGGGTGVNAADGNISFDPVMLSVQSVSKEGSIFNLWTSEPSFSNKDGTVTFSGGSNNAYTGSAGTIFTIIFKPLKSGSTTLKFSSGSALAADGQGTNVLSGLSTADITIKEGGASPSPSPTPPPTGGTQPAQPPPPPPAPPFEVAIDINSASHADQNKWYANNAPQFAWKLTPDVGGVATAFNQTP
ncbi:MAG: cohesin domain-containing protein, partial [bacterium]|nr:cohesin domain-containing protein [bacterium]